MTKTQYLNTLRSCLDGKIPEEELQDLLNYYEGYFEDAGIDNEAETIKNLDTPWALAAQILAEQMTSSSVIPPAVKPPLPDNQFHINKRTLWAAAIIALLLLVVGSSMYALVQKLNDSALKKSDSLYENPIVASADIGEMSRHYELYSLDNLNIDVLWGDIIIEPGDTLSVDTIWYRSEDALRCDYVDGLFTIRAVESASADTLDATAPMIRITIPSGKKPRELRLNTDYGVVTVNTISAGMVAMSSGTGNVTVTNCAFDSAALNVGSGDLYLEQLDSRVLDASLSSGNAYLTRCYVEETDISVHMGNAKLLEWPALERHSKIIFRTFLSNVIINGTDHGETFDFAGNGELELDVQCAMGKLVFDTMSN